MIHQNWVRSLNVGRVSSEGVGVRFFINMATGGLGVEISGTNGAE